MTLGSAGCLLGAALGALAAFGAPCYEPRPLRELEVRDGIGNFLATVSSGSWGGFSMMVS